MTVNSNRGAIHTKTLCRTLSRLMLLLLLVLWQISSQAAGAVQWDFDGNLNSSTGGLALEPGASAPATSPGVTFTTATIGSQTAQVAGFTRGTWFKLTHGLNANGGGAFLNQYTLVMDVMFPSRPTGWAALLQTNPGNGNDGDWFINGSGGLGISSVYGGSIANDQWNRIALVVDSAAGTFTSYLNGIQVQQISGVTLDSRWSLDSTALLFADEDQENAAGYVNSVQLRAGALGAADVAALGGPQASGVPLPQVPTALRVTSPNGGETLQAGTAQTVTWQAANPDGTVQIDLLLGQAVYRTLGLTLMRQSNFVWNIDPLIGDTNDYRIRVASVTYPSLQTTSAAPFTVIGSGAPPNPAFGRQVLSNGGFELGLQGWQIIAGKPGILSSANAKGSPYSGTNYLHAGLGSPGDTIVRQDIDLLAAGFTAADLDTGASIDGQAWLHSLYPLGTFDDQAVLRVAGLDSDGNETASARTMIVGNNTWVQRPLTALLPPGTRKLRVEVIGLHRRDTDNDAMADEIAIRLQRAWPVENPRITKPPVLQDYRADAMSLLWETDANLAQHAVEWGRNSTLEHTNIQVETIGIDPTHYVHRATLTGLEPETSYTYRVRSGGTNTPAYKFRTAPLPNTPFAVAWWADSQVDSGIIQQIIPSLLARPVDWIGIAGDVASDGGSLSDWHNYYFKPLASQNMAQTHPVLIARGNHDGEGPFSYAYTKLPGNESYYAFTYGNSRFIFLDSEAATSTCPDQYTWLATELARPETQNAAFRIVCFHKCPYANLWNGGGYTGETWVRNEWVPLFAAQNVDAVINGHAHNYNRGVTNGVTYLIVGGGGGALDTERVANWPLFTVEYSLYHYGLMSINDNTLTWQAISNTGQPLDTFKLTSRVPRVKWVTKPNQDKFALTVTGKPGTTYVTETSEDLQKWTSFATNVMPATAILTNELSVVTAKAYFRARAD